MHETSEEERKKHPGILIETAVFYVRARRGFMNRGGLGNNRGVTSIGWARSHKPR